MGTTTTTFALNKPTVGGDDNAWGTDWNTNADKLDDLLDGTTAIKPNLSDGLWKVGGVAVTSTAAELNILDGVTASTAELNILDGVTASTAEINILDGVTASTAELNILDGATLTVTELNYVDGVTSAIQTQLDAKYDSGDLASQAEAEAGTDNTKVMTPLRVFEAIQNDTAGWGQIWQTVTRSFGTSYQNTTSRPIQISVKTGGSGSAVQVSSNNSTWLTVDVNDAADYGHSSAIIPVNYYYRVTVTTPQIWVELR